MIATEWFCHITGFFPNFLVRATPVSPWVLQVAVLVSCLCLCAGYLWFERCRSHAKIKDLTEELAYWQNQAAIAQAHRLNDQLNPHFLFNNLGSLATLIEEDQTAAINFVEELSGVYRYVLKAYNMHLSPLNEELAFLNNYFALLQIRFGNNLQLEINIPDSSLNDMIPPLTLQLLIENAVKHNEITDEKPLYVAVSWKEDKLIIENNIQPKSTNLFSGKVGLQHIREKFRLLEAGEIEVNTVENVFRVTVPLIQRSSGNGFA